MPGCWRSPRSCGAGGRCHLRSSGSAPSAPCFQDPGWSYLLGSSSGESHKNGRLLEVNIKETGNNAMEEVSDRNSNGSASGGQCATSAPTLKLEDLFILFKLKSILFIKLPTLFSLSTSLKSASFMAVRSNPACRLSNCST